MSSTNTQCVTPTVDPVREVVHRADPMSTDMSTEFSGPTGKTCDLCSGGTTRTGVIGIVEMDHDPPGR